MTDVCFGVFTSLLQTPHLGFIRLGLTHLGLAVAVSLQPAVIQSYVDEASKTPFSELPAVLQRFKWPASEKVTVLMCWRVKRFWFIDLPAASQDPGPLSACAVFL